MTGHGSKKQEFMDDYRELRDVFLDNMTKIARKNSKIRPDLYQHYNVKRGLRNADGTGVLVNLTEIGDVHGYIIDEGEKKPAQGRLCYRGLNINDLVAGCQKERRFGFEETVFLLLFGQLPNKTELEKFNELLGRNRSLPEGFTENMILKAPGSNIMNKLARSVLAAYSYDKRPEDRSLKNILRQCIGLTAKFPTMAAYAYQAKSHYYDRKSLFIHNPVPELSTAGNFLRMIRADKRYSRAEAEILDLCLILHAEHGGGNNSTFTTHVVTSADTDIYSAIAAAIGSLKGSRHGGANVKVIRMMENIKEHIKDYSNDSQIADYLAKLIKREAYDKTGLIYGIGHAVYTLSDPRAVLLKKKAQKLAKEKGMEEEFGLYTAIERLTPEVFKKVKGSDKVIAANVDFYSGFVYTMLGIPVELYTPLFAIARVAGWSAHIIEERVSGGKINRPACKSVAAPRKYIPLRNRP